MIEKLKTINTRGWICMGIALALAIIDILNKFAGFAIEVPPLVGEALTAFAVGSRTTKK